MASLRIYGLLGREIATLVDEWQELGYHEVVWNGRDSRGRELPSGIYIARLLTREYNQSIKLLLLK